jgi:hypothetical protein
MGSNRRIHRTQAQDIADRIAAYMARQLAIPKDRVPRIPGELPQELSQELRQEPRETRPMGDPAPSKKGSAGLATMFSSDSFTPAPSGKAMVALAPQSAGADQQEQ